MSRDEQLDKLESELKELMELEWDLNSNISSKMDEIAKIKDEIKNNKNKIELLGE